MPRERSRLSRLRRSVTRSGAFVSALSFVAGALLRAWSWTIRTGMDVHPEAAGLDSRKVVYAFWHGRQFLLLSSFRNRGIVVMTSVSWAGRIQSRILTGMGYSVVRGSSGRKAVRALVDIAHAAESGEAAAFAVDGPSGPGRRCKPGVLYLARKLGYPIVPAATSARPSWRIGRTWCRYLVPAPFSRGVVLLGKPIHSAADGTLEAEELDRILDELTDEADARLAPSRASGGEHA
jgi:lysophospholipid acyltransferase (LPLAT)-like uncharacterized protein